MNPGVKGTHALARSLIVSGKWILSHMPEIVLTAVTRALSELLMVRRLEYLKKRPVQKDPNEKVDLEADSHGVAVCVKGARALGRSDHRGKICAAQQPVKEQSRRQFDFLLPSRFSFSTYGFSAPPTRDLSSPPFSFENVLHSEPTSMTLSPTTSPHSEQIMSPAR